MAAKLWQIQIRLHYQAVDGAVQLLENLGVDSISWYECEDAAHSLFYDDQGFAIAEEFYVMGYFKIVPDIETLKQPLTILTDLLKIPEARIVVNEVNNTDWLKECYQQLKPFTVGRYYVYGSHIINPDFKDKIPLRIDAATAFGSGEHQSTTGCLLALDELAHSYQFSHLLDMGCGSGILAIAMAKTWSNATITAVDNDEESVRVTIQNAELNGCQDQVLPIHSQGFADFQMVFPFDLIVANILAGPLCEMAKDMANALKTGGMVILSGLLERQKNQVLEACVNNNILLKKTYSEGEWTTLILEKQ